MTVAMRGEGAPAAIGGDALVVTAFAGELGPAASEVDASLGGVLGVMVASGEVRGRFGEVTVVAGGNGIAAGRVVLLGLGERAKLDSYRLHNAYTLVGRELRRRRMSRVVLAGDPSLAGGPATDLAALLRAMVTGTLIANFDAGMHKSDDERPPAIEEVVVAGLDAHPADSVDASLADAVLLADSTLRVQRWTSEPSNRMTPTLLAGAVRELCEGVPVTVEVMERAELEAAGAGALLGIAKGSDEPPLMIVVRYDGAPGDERRLALVGKGITFDTGGISIKPSLHMEMMKSDMGGGAAVLAAVHTIAALAVRCNVTAIVPATENMPGGHALKPGDVVTAIDGTTIEVVNTDAEGRVVLADGLGLARRLRATHIVDVATLTGAAIIALGHVSSALMSNDADLTALVQRGAREAGDRFAELPMHPEYDVCLRSDVADVVNWGGREAGTISGGIFIRAFAGELPWVHLDIAGTSWNDQGNLKEVPDGPSGAPVRTLVWLARFFAGE
ncbi:MAG: leucyl aminopeptidase [Candidatus Dormibacter sp.]